MKKKYAVVDIDGTLAAGLRAEKWKDPLKNPHEPLSQEWHEYEDTASLFRLYVRGIITGSERAKALRRMKKRWMAEREKETSVSESASKASRPKSSPTPQSIRRART